MIREIQSCFPRYYNHAAWIGLAILFAITLALGFARDLLAPSWLLIAPGILAYFVTGHAGAFVVQYFRIKWNKTDPADVAKPVAYYTPDMPAASYQPTFLKLSTLIKLVIFGAVVETLFLGLDLVRGHFSLTWDVLQPLFSLFGALGFIRGCREIQRQENAAPQDGVS